MRPTRPSLRFVSFVVGAALALPTTAAAADDVQVNSYTTGFQGATIAASTDADGDFVVLWESVGSAGTDSDGSSVQGQRYNSSGAAIGSEFQVNTYTTGPQGEPSVALDEDGDMIAVWQSAGSAADTSGTTILGQRYAADGSLVGAEMQVNQNFTASQQRPAVDSENNGDFVAVWGSEDSNGTDSSGNSVQGMRFASDGSVIGTQFQVNTYTTNSQGPASVAVDDDGDFVVVWQSLGSSGTDTDLSSIQGQLYAADGTAVGGEFQINTITTGRQEEPSVSSDANGNFVVSWHSKGSDGTDGSLMSIQAQRYAFDGMMIGGQFEVNSYQTSYQNYSSVAMDSDGDFVVVWQSDGSSTDPSDYSIHGQRYAANGNPIGGELQINTYFTGDQTEPVVVIDDAGEFIVAWQSQGSEGTDDSVASVQRSMAATVPVELMSFSIEE